MAGLDPGLAIPVWLAEDDLGCIICQGLLAWPATLPCGHSFCRDCLKDLWAAGSPGRRRPARGAAAGAAPEPARPPPRRAAQLSVGRRTRAAVAPLGPARVPAAPRSDPCPGPPALTLGPPALGAAAAQKSITEAGHELEELVEQLVDLVRSLQSQTHLPEPGPDNEGSNQSLLVTPHTPERKLRDILHDLEEIREKLRENLTWKEALEEQPQVELQEGPSSSACPLSDHSHPAPTRTSRFAQWAVSPTFDLRSHCCSLEVSEDCRVVTVSRCPQTHLWSHERFVTCQVLCSQAFSSGQQYWEVDTQHCNNWAVGVASWGMRRNQTLGRTEDSWCVEWKGTGQLSAWHMVKETILGSDRPKVVGIWLDLEEGKLAFYSVANQETLLYECPVSASSPLHPAFWLYGLNPGNALTIRPVKV
ncbi:e3 ubiquitin-protein ligase [Lynx pardinus]|uniref:E3 ubiquitin-protein ligase n=1 Tax=Lynx pardinus TaxID=191816 RepID=A0A485N8W9_LYNPA|nr:e3 ubiquitin-protein ligase [Lynx pardinus]